jgi:hypothetical protein
MAIHAVFSTPATSGIDRARILCERGDGGYHGGIFDTRHASSALTKHCN